METNDITFLPTPGASYQDAGFNYKVWVTARRVYFTDEAFLHYRQDNLNSSINSPGKVFCVADEYTEIERYLTDKGLIDELGPLMRATRWGAYAWNIDRLTAELAEDFIRFASGQYKEEHKNGTFNYENCDANLYRSIYEIIHHPDMAIERKKAIESAKVSVIVPAYNVERYLKKSLDSILNQTFKDLEVIIVDDGSSDMSPNIADDYFQEDSRVTVFNQHNNGLSAARNRGIDLSHCEHIMFVDSDDYLEISAIERMYREFEFNVDLVVGSARVVYEDNNYTAQEKNDDRQYYSTKYRGNRVIDDHLLQRMDVAVWNKMYKTSVINDNGIRFPHGLHYEDTYFTHVYAWVSRNAYFLPSEDYVYNYVRRSSSIMARTFKGVAYAYDHMEIAFRLYDFLKQNDIFDQHAKYYGELFESYFKLAYRYLPDGQYGRLYGGVQWFINVHGDELRPTHPEIVERIESLLPGTTSSGSVKGKLKGVVKRATRKLLIKTSVSYRSQRHLLTAIERLEERLTLMDVRNQASIEKINNDLEYIYGKLKSGD